MVKIDWDSYYDPPDYGPCFCEVCVQNVDNEECICHECPECGEFGNPLCYIEHGLRRTEEQKFSAECAFRLGDYENWAYWESMKKYVDDDIESEATLD